MARWLERGFLLLALVCLGAPTASWLDAAVYQLKQGERLERLIATADRLLPDPFSGAASAAGHRDGGNGDGLVGRIEIPRLGLSAIVAEGVDARTLRRAVGHQPGTALPGQPGNVVLAGHRDTFFRALRNIHPTDHVRITTIDGIYDFEVDHVSIVSPDRVDILAPTAEPTLTLVTCYPFNYIGPAPRRFIVHARAAVTHRPSARDGVSQRQQPATDLLVARRYS